LKRNKLIMVWSRSGSCVYIKFGYLSYRVAKCWQTEWQKQRQR